MRVAVVLAILAVCVPASAQSLAEAAAKEAARRATIKEPAKVYTDKDLPQASRAAPAKDAPTKPGEGKSRTSARPGETRTTDDNGHDEQWWKARADVLRQKLNEATMRLEIARRRADAISADMNRSVSIARPSPTTRSAHDATAEVDRRAAEVLRAGRALDDLEEEARKAGALPGWLRR